MLLSGLVPLCVSSSKPLSYLGLVSTLQCTGSNLWGRTLLQPRALPAMVQDSCLLPACSAVGAVEEHACGFTKESLGDHYVSSTVKEPGPF